MTLTDAGPLIALIDAGEADHDRCRGALDELALPMVTTWPAFTEAIYLLGRAGGWRAQAALWKLVEREVLLLAELSPESTSRSAELMRRYRDQPMDLADATLVALAEQRDLRVVFSLDHHFRSYGLRGGRYLELVPG